MTCPANRDTCDPEHPTCRQLIALGECNPKKAKKRKVVKQVETWHRHGHLFTTQYFYSVNHWHLKKPHVYLNYKKEWEQVLKGTWALFGKAKAKKRKVMIRRIVDSKKKLVSDMDNLVAGAKPVLDLLTQQGVIRDDTTDDIDFSIEQRVGAADVVEIIVEDAA